MVHLKTRHRSLTAATGMITETDLRYRSSGCYRASRGGSSSLRRSSSAASRSSFWQKLRWRCEKRYGGRGGGPERDMRGGEMVVGRRDERRTSAERKGADIDQAASSFRPTTREQKEKKSAFAILRLRGVLIDLDLAYQLARGTARHAFILSSHAVFGTCPAPPCCVRRSPRIPPLLLSTATTTKYTQTHDAHDETLLICSFSAGALGWLSTRSVHYSRRRVSV